MRTAIRMSVACAAAIFAVGFANPLATTVVAAQEVIDTVTLENVIPAVVGSGDFRSYSIQNGGQVRSIDFSGSITEINTSTFISEIAVDIFGSGASLARQALSRVNDFQGTTTFSGNYPLDALIEAGDFWAFNFFETFDDGGDNEADANLDITFSFLDYVPEGPTETDLGIFGLDQGSYQRGGDTNGSYPYTVVPIEVSESGSYTLDAAWLSTETGSSFDGYLYVFDSPFAGTDVNAIASNDDDLSTANSRLDVDLLVGQVYYALFTTFSSRTDGDVLQGRLTAFSDAGVARVVGAVPEPGATLSLTLGVLTLLTQRRRTKTLG